MARNDFPDRWEDAVDRKHLPELITADRLVGLLVDLEAKGRLIGVRSQRLTLDAEAASCADFTGPLALPGRRLAARGRGPEGRGGAAQAGTGDAPSGRGTPRDGGSGRGRPGREARRDRLYLGRSRAAPGGRLGLLSATVSLHPAGGAVGASWDVEAGSVELRGNEAIAFARVEMQFRGKTMIGADPVAVVLRREGSHWKAFSVGNDVFCLRALPELCRLALRPPSGPQSPPAPRLSYPDDDKPIGTDGRSFAWEIPAGGEPLAAQVCEVLLDVKGGELADEPDQGLSRRAKGPVAHRLRDDAGRDRRDRRTRCDGASGPSARTGGSRRRRAAAIASVDAGPRR